MARLTYTGMRNLFGDLTDNNQSDHLTFGDTLINQHTHRRLNPHDFVFLQDSTTDTTVASQKSYNKPIEATKIRTIVVTQGNTDWPVREVTSQDDWNRLQETDYESDIPVYFHVYGDQYQLWPTPSTAGNTITVTYKKKIKDLSVADYTTGTISITSGEETVTGVGTTFTAEMVGRYLKTTDGFWYKIATFTSTTELELAQPYEGTTVSGGTYTIGELSIFPDGYELIPVYDATADYLESFAEEVGRADRFRDRADQLFVQMKSDWGSQTTGVTLEGPEEGDIINPNLYIRG